MYACLCEAVCDVTTVPSHLKAGPPSFEFLVIFDFLHHGIEDVERHLL